jgi:hypothetical protein
MITDKVIIDSINATLLERYRVLDGRPIYRIVWSDDQMELRKGNYNEFYGHIFLRNYTAIKWIKKYWNYNTPRWVFEKLVFIAGNKALKEMQDELVQSGNGTYEPIYSFVDKDENPLPVVWEVVEFMLWKLHNPAGVNPSLAKAAVEAEEAAEVKYFEDQLHEGERSPLFVWENSAFVSTNQLRFKQEYVEKGISGV